MTEPPGGSSEGLRVEGLVKDFGPIRAVDEVSFTLSEGGALALFGPNGAGKSTLLRILAGLLRPDRGRVYFGGSPRPREDRSWRRRIGVLSHRTFLYDHLTALENLLFHADLHALEDAPARAAEALERVGLASRAGDAAGGFSRGMRQRLGLARTLLHDPDLVLLDEPFSGLDPHGGILLVEVLEALRDGRRSVVLVTHDLSRGLEIAEEWAILVQGRMRRSGRSSEVERAGFEHLYHAVVEAE